jgi:hypothetical protein
VQKHDQPLGGGGLGIEARAGQFSGHRQELRRWVGKPSSAKRRVAPVTGKSSAKDSSSSRPVHCLLGGTFLSRKIAAKRAMIGPAGRPARLRIHAVLPSTDRPRPPVA